MDARQQGMTVLSIMMTGIFIIMFSLIAMRIIPVYLQHQLIMQSIEDLKNLPQDELDSEKSDISWMRHILLENLAKKAIEESLFDVLIIKPKADNSWEISVQYRVVQPLIYKISLLFDFKDTKEVTIATN